MRISGIAKKITCILIVVAFITGIIPVFPAQNNPIPNVGNDMKITYAPDAADPYVSIRIIDDDKGKTQGGQKTEYYYYVAGLTVSECLSEGIPTGNYFSLSLNSSPNSIFSDTDRCVYSTFGDGNRYLFCDKDEITADITPNNKKIYSFSIHVKDIMDYLQIVADSDFLSEEDAGEAEQWSRRLKAAIDENEADAFEYIKIDAVVSVRGKGIVCDSWSGWQASLIPGYNTVEVTGDSFPTYWVMDKEGVKRTFPVLFANVDSDMPKKDIFMTRYPWTYPTGINILWDNYVLIGVEKRDDEDSPIENKDDGIRDEILFSDGFLPDIEYYNKSDSGEYNLADGIPSSEYIRTGCRATSWYGNMDVRARILSKRMPLYIRYNYNVKRPNSRIDGSPMKNIKCHIDIYTYVDIYTAYLYLANAHFYKLSNITLKNDAYDADYIFRGSTVLGDSECFSSAEYVDIDKDENVEGAVDTGYWEPDDGKHLNSEGLDFGWDDLDIEKWCASSSVYVELDRENPIEEKDHSRETVLEDEIFPDIAELFMESETNPVGGFASETLKNLSLRNDSLKINGTTYLNGDRMSGDIYSFHEDDKIEYRKSASAPIYKNGKKWKVLNNWEKLSYWTWSMDSVYPAWDLPSWIKTLDENDVFRFNQLVDDADEKKSHDDISDYSVKRSWEYILKNTSIEKPYISPVALAQTKDGFTYKEDKTEVKAGISEAPEKTIQIPPRTENGVYGTDVAATYTRFIRNDGRVEQFRRVVSSDGNRAEIVKVEYMYPYTDTSFRNSDGDSDSFEPFSETQMYYAGGGKVQEKGNLYYTFSGIREGNHEEEWAQKPWGIRWQESRAAESLNEAVRVWTPIKAPTKIVTLGDDDNEDGVSDEKDPSDNTDSDSSAGAENDNSHIGKTQLYNGQSFVWVNNKKIPVSQLRLDKEYYIKWLPNKKKDMGGEGDFNDGTDDEASSDGTPAEDDTVLDRDGDSEDKGNDEVEDEDSDETEVSGENTDSENTEADTPRDSDGDEGIKGYSNASDINEYDRYVIKKEMKFPFKVVYEGCLYERDTWITVNSPYNFSFDDLGGGSADSGASRESQEADGKGYKTPAAPKKESGYLKSDNHWSYTPFYIPSFAEEVGGKYDDDNPVSYTTDSERNKHRNYSAAFVQYRVSAINKEGRYDGEHFEEQYDANVTFNGDKTAYAATWSTPVQTSGWIYDFTVLGISDGSTFAAAGEAKVDSHTSYSFAEAKEEKKYGEHNRLGKDYVFDEKKEFSNKKNQTGNAVRFCSGSVSKGKISDAATGITAESDENTWPKSNILPFQAGSSTQYSDLGCLSKGDTISFSLKTMANLWNDTDYIEIIPHYSFVKEDGIVLEEDKIKLYYQTPDSDNFVEFDKMAEGDGTDPIKDGSEIEFKGFNDGGIDSQLNVKGFNLTETSFSDDVLKGSFGYDKDNSSWLTETLGLTHNDVKITGDDKVNFHYWRAVNSRGDSGIGLNELMNRKTGTGNFSHIYLTSGTRLFTGEYTDLEGYMNDDYAFSKSCFVNSGDSTNNRQIYKEAQKDSYGNSLGNMTDSTDSPFDDMLKASVQTWYGQYHIPQTLYVVDTSDGNRGGNPDYQENSTFSLAKYAEEKQKSGRGLSNDDDIFEKRGYLLLSFEIYSYKCQVKDNSAEEKNYSAKTKKDNSGDKFEYRKHLSYDGNCDGKWKSYAYSGYKTESGKNEIKISAPIGTNKVSLTVSAPVAFISISSSTDDKYRRSIFNIN